MTERIELNSEILVYTGRSRGRDDRNRFQLQRLDAQDGVVVVVVPDTVYTMTSSYFLGLFGDSIRKLGRESFLIKYQIVAPDHVSRKVDDWISRAIRDKKDIFGGEL